MKSKVIKLLYKSRMGPIDLGDVRRRVSKERRSHQWTAKVKPSLFESFRKACEREGVKQVDVLEVLLIEYVRAVEANGTRSKKKSK